MVGGETGKHCGKGRETDAIVVNGVTGWKRREKISVRLSFQPNVVHWFSRRSPYSTIEEAMTHYIITTSLLTVMGIDAGNKRYEKKKASKLR